MLLTPLRQDGLIYNDSNYASNGNYEFCMLLSESAPSSILIHRPEDDGAFLDLQGLQQFYRTYVSVSMVTLLPISELPPLPHQRRRLLRPQPYHRRRHALGRRLQRYRHESILVRRPVRARSSGECDTEQGVQEDGVGGLCGARGDGCGEGEWEWPAA